MTAVVVAEVTTYGIYGLGLLILTAA